jgi:Kef-type K+ transport system membrane component KefB
LIRLKLSWKCLKPFLFPIIGSSITVSDIPASTLLKALLLIVLAVSIKLVATLITSIVCGLDGKESMFVSGLWTGKASIQATLCGAAMEMVHRHHLENQVEQEYAKLVFLCMVCSIVVGVPTASSWVSMFGKVPLGIVGTGSGTGSVGVGMGLLKDMVDVEVLPHSDSF